MREEPVLCGEVEDYDDWTKYSSDVVQEDVEREPLTPMVQDEFNPIALEEEVNWEDGGYTDVAVEQVIKKLDDELVHLMKNPRLHSLSRLPCFCHLLQVSKVIFNWIQTLRKSF